jgi:hypothetical protein
MNSELKPYDIPHQKDSVKAAFFVKVGEVCAVCFNRPNRLGGA